MTWWKVLIRKLQWSFAVLGSLMAWCPPLSLLVGFMPIVILEIVFFDGTGDEGRGY